MKRNFTIRWLLLCSLLVISSTNLNAIANEPVEFLKPTIYSTPIGESEGEAQQTLQESIKPFLVRMHIEDANAINKQPSILASNEHKYFLLPGSEAYTTAITEPTKRWSIYRPTVELIDPETKKSLGVQFQFQGTAVVLKQNSPSKIRIENAAGEIRPGDLLYPEVKQKISTYKPSIPDSMINASIVSIFSSISTASENSILALNRGTQHGVKVGHILKLVRNSKEHDYSSLQFADKKEIGQVFVYSVFDKVSYAIVTKILRPISISDKLQSPIASNTK